MLRSAYSLYTLIAYKRNTKLFWPTFVVLATHSPSLGFCPLHSDKEAVGVTPPEAESSEVPCSALAPALSPWLCVPIAATECSCWDGARDLSQGLVVCHHRRSSLDAPSAGSRGSSVWKKITCQIFHQGMSRHITIREGAVCAWTASLLVQISMFWCRLFPARIFNEVIPSFPVERVVKQEDKSKQPWL